MTLLRTSSPFGQRPVVFGKSPEFDGPARLRIYAVADALRYTEPRKLNMLKQIIPRIPDTNLRAFLDTQGVQLVSDQNTGSFRAVEEALQTMSRDELLKAVEFALVLAGGRG